MVSTYRDLLSNEEILGHTLKHYLKKEPQVLERQGGREGGRERERWNARLNYNYPHVSKLPWLTSSSFSLVDEFCCLRYCTSSLASSSCTAFFLLESTSVTNMYWKKQQRTCIHVNSGDTHTHSQTHTHVHTHTHTYMRAHTHWGYVML